MDFAIKMTDFGADPRPGGWVWESEARRSAFYACFPMNSVLKMTNFGFKSDEFWRSWRRSSARWRRERGRRSRYGMPLLTDLKCHQWLTLKQCHHCRLRSLASRPTRPGGGRRTCDCIYMPAIDRSIVLILPRMPCAQVPHFLWPTAQHRWFYTINHGFCINNHGFCI